MEDLVPEPAKFVTPLYCSVILDEKFPKPLDYKIPSTFASLITLGTRVVVPLKTTEKKGYVIALKNQSSFPSVKSLKGVLPEELWLPKELFSLASWMQGYYGCSYSQALHSMIPKSIREEITPATQVFLERKLSKKKILEKIPHLREKAPIQAKLLSFFLKRTKGIFLQELIEKTSSSQGPIDALVQKGYLQKKKLAATEEDFLSDLEFFPTTAKILNEEQEKALTGIKQSLEEKKFSPFLLFGVTGSGKTEVYLQAMEKALSLNQSVLILVPEVALSSQLVEKLRARFQKPVALFHHKRSLGQRYQSWMQVKSQDAQILLGARSAVFAPLKNLGLLIVDEEHETSYKQTEEAPTYHARDIAIMRGKLQNCSVVLGSATPSMESFTNAKKGKYTLLTLTKRAKSQKIPEIQIIDQKIELQKQGGFTHFSSPLLQKIKEKAEKGEQTLLFLNKRGYYSSKVCKNCLEPYHCPHCDLSLTFHKKENFLLCHLCGYRCSTLQKCPRCKEAQAGEFKGFGTQHVEASLKGLFPDLRILRMDRDTTTSKEGHEKIFQEFRSGKADVLIGTQMIAKGFHFPQVTLVGILQPDFLLQIPDFRSSEYLFQLLNQVAGRAGREDLPGEVLLQTFHKNHPFLQLAAKGDYLSFYEQEMQQRKLLKYPPFQRIIRIVFSGKKEEEVMQKAQSFFEQTKKLLPKEITQYPVVPCGYAKIKDRFRFQMILFTTKMTPTIALLKPLKQQKESLSFRIFLEVDPTHLFF